MKNQKMQAEVLILGKLIFLKSIVQEIIQVFTPPIAQNLSQDAGTVSKVELNLSKAKKLSEDLSTDMDKYCGGNYCAIWEPAQKNENSASA